MKSSYFNLYKHTDSLPAGTAYTSPRMIFHQTDVLQGKAKFIFIFGFLQGFWYFALWRSRKIQVNLRNPAKCTKHEKYHEIQ